MKQLVQNVSMGRAMVVEVPAPRPGRGELLVRVGASLVSAGTERMVVEFTEKNLVQKALARPDLVRQVVEKATRDGIVSTLETVRQRLDSEIALGYSNAGTVIELGPDVSGFKIGDRVACAGGSFASHAEIVRVPRNLVATIPAREGGQAPVPFEDAAFTTLGAIALQGLRLATPQLGETVAVIGLGLVGLLVVQLAAAAGCRVIGLDPIADRCRLACELGSLAAGQTTEQLRSQVMASSGGNGADAVIICASTANSSPIQAAGEVARDRARVAVVGAVALDIPRKLYYEKELSVIISRSYGPGRYDSDYEEKGHDYPVGYVRWTENRNLQAFLQLLADDKVKVHALITHRIGVEEAERAYELISGKKGEPYLGVVITYPAQSSVVHRTELQCGTVPRAAPLAKLTVGMLGAGNFARSVLLPAMQATGEVDFTGLASASGASARALGARFGFRYCSADSQELLCDADINTVVIATRHHLHAAQVVAGLMAGKHVFCEKPLCISEHELAEIVRTHQAVNSATCGKILMVGFNRRFAPLAQRMHHFLCTRAEPMVMHYRVNAGYLPPNHWTQDPQQGGGRVVGEICHFVDFLASLAGSPVASVHALGMPNRGRYCDDNVVSVLEFEDGSVGTITYVANGDKSFSKERIEVFAGNTVAVLDDFRSLALVRGGRQQKFKSRLRQDKGHRAEWQAFSQAISSGGAAPIPFAQLVNTTLTTFAIQQSLRTGRRQLIDTQAFLETVAVGASGPEHS